MGDTFVRAPYPILEPAPIGDFAANMRLAPPAFVGLTPGMLDLIGLMPGICETLFPIGLVAGLAKPLGLTSVRTCKPLSSAALIGLAPGILDCWLFVPPVKYLPLNVYGFENID